MRRIYFDTEFTGLKKDTDLISIGCVTRTNNGLKHFYAEIKDISIGKLDKWIKDNVIKNCLFLGKNKIDNKKFILQNFEYCFDTFNEVSTSLNKWIEEIAISDLKNGGDGQIEFVSDVSSYDFVLLIDLLTNHKSALDLPNYITSDCYNINQLIADKLFDKSDLGDAFDITREEYLSERDKEEFILNKILGDAKHNALWDAYVISKIGERYGL